MVHVRSWATPLTIGSFVLMTATGVLMFFEREQGLMTVVHQWFSWLFLVGAGGHILVNFRPFKRHLSSRWGKVNVATFTALFAASFSTWGMMTGPQLERPVELALVEAPLSALADLTRTPSAALLGRLQAHGFSATGEQSIRELTEAHGVDENRLLGIIFLPQ